jgi:hypothetical protein
MVQRRKGMQVLVNEEAFLDIPPCFAVGRISALAQLEGGSRASVVGGESDFGVGCVVRSIALVLLKNHRPVWKLSEFCLL